LYYITTNIKETLHKRARSWQESNVANLINSMQTINTPFADSGHSPHAASPAAAAASC